MTDMTPTSMREVLRDRSTTRSVSVQLRNLAVFEARAEFPGLSGDEFDTKVDELTGEYISDLADLVAKGVRGAARTWNQLNAETNR